MMWSFTYLIADDTFLSFFFSIFAVDSDLKT